MSQNTTGWIVFIAALGMMVGLVAVDVQSLEAWESARTPAFIGRAMFSFSTVVTAFIGGKLLPAPRSRATNQTEE